MSSMYLLSLSLPLSLCLALALLYTYLLPFAICIPSVFHLLYTFYLISPIYCLPYVFCIPSAFHFSQNSRRPRSAGIVKSVW
jgi:hypothetical protein